MNQDVMDAFYATLKRAKDKYPLSTPRALADEWDELYDAILSHGPQSRRAFEEAIDCMVVSARLAEQALRLRTGETLFG